MKQQYFIRLTIQVGYNYIKVMNELEHVNLVQEITGVHSSNQGVLVCVDFITPTTTEESIEQFAEKWMHLIELIVYKPLK